jgi:type II secretory ATPase GspE/PulE/Tfp pilus assembly ATPase PilB-like protein
MRIDEQREPQDGRIDMEYLGRRLSCRASCLPSLNGEKLVMRILDPQAMKVDLAKLGMPEDIYSKWFRAINAPYGLILVTGPTGSGKTSTLYASLNVMDAKSRNIVTVEDPIEYEYEKNIAQVQVSERMSFPRVMRSFLRQDPDVMLVGEMRDPDSLAIGIQAGLTGHLVLSTLHTNNAIETIGRMVDMDAEPYLIAGVTLAILAQRLVRLNCAKCRQPYKPTEDEILALQFTPEELEKGTFMKGAGCSECKMTGYKGRIGIFEIIIGTPEFKAAIATNPTFATLAEVAKKQGHRTMLDDGKAKAMSGWSTPDEIMRAVMTVAL